MKMEKKFIIVVVVVVLVVFFVDIPDLYCKIIWWDLGFCFHNRHSRPYLGQRAGNLHYVWLLPPRQSLGCPGKVGLQILHLA
jgi:hypothetical protein